MSQLIPAPLLTPLAPPAWSHCAHGNNPQDPVGCPGIRVPGHTECLAHLTDADRGAYLTSLAPGSDIDHRGTTFTPLLLTELLNAVRDSAIGHPRFGYAGFSAAIFEGDADFTAAIFENEAEFRSATFKSRAFFVSATFGSDTTFRSAAFERRAQFGSTTFRLGVDFGSATFEHGAGFVAAAFEGYATFGSAVFQGATSLSSATFKLGASFRFATFERGVDFRLATFEDDAMFNAATFVRGVDFGSAAFEGDADFESATFERAAILGPLVCAGWVNLSGAVFGSPVSLWFAARNLACRRTRWSSTAEIRLRYTRVDIAHAVFEYPLTIAAERDPFLLPNGQQMAETLIATDPDASVRMTSLRGVDAAHLVLSDVDLSECHFTGTVHLDQVRLEGACSFATVPSGRHWRCGLPVWFTQRRTLAEEHHWRARQPVAVPGWNAAPSGAGRAGPLQLAPVYRALRKAFEDGKHEPGAADFYYGEMEMRRHADDIPEASEVF